MSNTRLTPHVTNSRPLSAAEVGAVDEFLRENTPSKFPPNALGIKTEIVDWGKVEKGKKRKQLTAEDVLSIREDTRTHKEIAADYGVGVKQIGRIKRREAWTHI